VQRCRGGEVERWRGAEVLRCRCADVQMCMCCGFAEVLSRCRVRFSRGDCAGDWSGDWWCIGESCRGGVKQVQSTSRGSDEAADEVHSEVRSRSTLVKRCRNGGAEVGRSRDDVAG
jgi:hypothetical protein